MCVYVIEIRGQYHIRVIKHKYSDTENYIRSNAPRYDIIVTYFSVRNFVWKTTFLYKIASIIALNYVPKMLSSATVQHQQPQQQKHFNGTRSKRLHCKIINIIIAVMMVLLGYCIEGKWRERKRETFIEIIL